MKIGITYDLKSDWPARDGDPRDINAEFDKPETVEMIIEAIAGGGHEVQRIGNVQQLLKCVERLDVDIVYNVCEGRSGRNRESQVPMLLELYGIPYVGADALTLGLTLDKVIAKKVFLGQGIPTPRFFQTDQSALAEDLNDIGYPLIVKTCHEGSSKGLEPASRVEDLGQLQARIDYVSRHYHQPALVEEFIPGMEFTVAVLGNKQPQAMPVALVSINGRIDLQTEIYTNALIYSAALEYLCPAPIGTDLTRRVQDLAVQVFRAVDCRDLARVDFRVDRQGQPHVLEINPLPTMDKEDVFHLFPKLFGLDFQSTVNIILNLALSRYGLIAMDESQILRPFLAKAAV